MYNLVKISLTLLLIANRLNAQCNPQSLIKNPVAPDPCLSDRVDKPFPVKYVSLREADVMWSKRTWRLIDLREKLNQPMYYPMEPKVCLMSLFDVLKCAILEGDLTAFANPAFDDEFTNPMTKTEVRDLLISWDSSAQVEDVNNPGTMLTVPLKTEISSGDVYQYWIKEDWFFDKQRSVMEVRIIGICPLTQKKSVTGDVLGMKPLFWIYFPEARPYFSRAAVFNRWNDNERMNYDELFQKRMFASYVYKESNVFDRSIAEYKTGMDAMLESDEIKEEIFKFESNFWHY
jgi:gliding motility associated protien GldN